MAWYAKNSGFAAHPVGQKLANAWGLYDMHGNVGEWCWDRYGTYPDGSETDPDGAMSGMHRVLRGGGANYPVILCLSASRGFMGPTHRFNTGLRLVLVCD